MKLAMPVKYEHVRDAMIARKIIPDSRKTWSDSLGSFTAEDEQKLFVALAYEYAEMMVNHNEQ